MCSQGGMLKSQQQGVHEMVQDAKARSFMATTVGKELTLQAPWRPQIRQYREQYVPRGCAGYTRPQEVSMIAAAPRQKQQSLGLNPLSPLQPFTAGLLPKQKGNHG